MISRHLLARSLPRQRLKCRAMAQLFPSPNVSLSSTLSAQRPCDTRRCLHWLRFDLQRSIVARGLATSRTTGKDDGSGKKQPRSRRDDEGKDGSITEAERVAAETSRAAVGSATPGTSSDDDVDFFGVNFDDNYNLGPVLPPKYKRDATTGRMTGEIEVELTDADRATLAQIKEFHEGSNDGNVAHLLQQRLQRRWRREQASDPTDVDAVARATGLPHEVSSLGQRVRHQQATLHASGRSVRAVQQWDDVDGTSETSPPLTRQEFAALKKYINRQVPSGGGQIQLSPDDFPVRDDDSASLSHRRRPPDGNDDDDYIDPDSDELATRWLTTRAQRQMNEDVDDNPYADLMPGDLAPTRLVNRQRAKPIPPHLLHHNNVALLATFLTPTGQIQNRIQSRLGARDQRKIAKLIKRARSLGLLPYSGQCKVERHGYWAHHADIHEERPWERELRRRGLLTPKQKWLQESHENSHETQESSDTEHSD